MTFFVSRTVTCVRRPPAEFDRVIAALKIAADIHLRLADFAFPRLGRIDLAGEAPVPAQQGRPYFTASTSPTDDPHPGGTFGF